MSLSVWQFTHGNQPFHRSELLDLTLELSGERTKKAAVTKALREFVARRQQKRLLDLMGKLDWESSFDYKAERNRARVCSSAPASGRSPFVAFTMGGA